MANTPVGRADVVTWNPDTWPPGAFIVLTILNVLWLASAFWHHAVVGMVLASITTASGFWSCWSALQRERRG